MLLQPFLIWRGPVVLRQNFYFYSENTLFLFCEAHNHVIFFFSITLFLVSDLGPGPVLRFLYT